MKGVLDAETAARVRQFQPKVIIAMGANSIKHMLDNIDDIPIVGAFFYSAPDALGFPRSNATGVTRGSYAADQSR